MIRRRLSEHRASAGFNISGIRYHTTRAQRLHRFFVPPEQIRGSAVTLEDPREIHHVRDVLRLGAGDQVVCVDGTGREYLGTITTATRAKVIVQVGRVTESPIRGPRLWLAQGLSKASKRFDWVVQKATELGAARMSPLLTRHTVVRLAGAEAERKQARWQRIAQEAAKQCRRATVPAVDPPQPLEAFLKAAAGDRLILMPTLAVTAIPLKDVLRSQPAVHEVAVLIGPEGDFSREEVALAEQYGARPVSLGALTLRTETAALAALAILAYELGG